MNDGISFEAKVERWLRHRYGAGFTERRSRVQGKIMRHGHEVDVHAEIVNELYKVLATFGALGLVIASLTVLFNIDVAFTVVSGILGGISLVLALVLYNDPRHLWVECKSGEGTVRRDVVWKLVGQVQDVRAYAMTGQPAWYPHDVWLVVRSQFDVDALRLAADHDIRCFVEQAGDIREVV